MSALPSLVRQQYQPGFGLKSPQHGLQVGGYTREKPKSCVFECVCVCVCYMSGVCVWEGVCLCMACAHVYIVCMLHVHDVHDGCCVFMVYDVCCVCMMHVMCVTCA